MQSQITPDLTENAAEIARHLRNAKAAGADIVHFPEAALTGYVKHQIKDWADVDWPASERALADLRSLCAELSIAAVIGAAHRPSTMERPFNSLFVIDAGGKIAGRYDKRYCSHTEITDWFRAGRDPFVVEIKGHKIGFLLCIEVQFPELFMAYAALGVECICLSAYSDSPMFALQAQGHAACNNIWISYSVPANASDDQAACQIGPDGSVIATCMLGESSQVLGTVDPDAPQWDVPCKKARPWRKLARQGDIYR